MLPLSKRMTIVFEALSAFSYNELISARSLLTLVRINSITAEEIAELISYVEQHPQSLSMAKMPVGGNVAGFPRCPLCQFPLMFRKLIDNPKRFNSNFACGAPACDFDYYTARTIEEVINEGIGDYDSPSTVEGITVERV